MKTTKTLSINPAASTTPQPPASGTKTITIQPGPEISAADMMQKVKQEPTPEPAPAPVEITAAGLPAPAETPQPEPTRAELIAQRTARLNRLNQVAAQVAKMDKMRTELDRFVFDLQGDDDRHFSTIVLIDDKRTEFRVTNMALCALLTDYLKGLIAGKLAEKEAELLSIQL